MPSHRPVARSFPWPLAALAGVAVLVGPALAEETVAMAAPKAQPRQECLSEAEIREEVAAKRVISQVTALRAARAVAGGEVVKARLCRGEDGLVYAITSLKRDGKVLRIGVDAVTGRVVDRD